MDTIKAICPLCGQAMRSEQRVKNHMAKKCLATGKWKKKSSTSTLTAYDSVVKSDDNQGTVHHRS